MAKAKKQKPDVPEKILVDNPDCEVATKGYVKKLSRSVLAHRHDSYTGAFSCVVCILTIFAVIAMVCFRVTPPPELASVLWTILIVSGINTLDALFASDGTPPEVYRTGDSWFRPDLEDAKPEPVEVEFRKQC